MMATHQPQKDLFAFHVDLDRRVRSHHPLRQVKKLIDFSFVRAELLKLHSRLGATMIYVTHDQLEAVTMGQRIAVMNEGVIQQVADPVTLCNAPANSFVSRFIGAAPTNR